MTKHKSHNSILVLATLGVYLGLVLVGATPQVLAQAAMTRQFDVKDEIEYKDDLDTKPDSASDDSERSLKPEAEGRVTSSIQRFLSQFRTIGEEAAFLPPNSEKPDLEGLRATHAIGTASYPSAPNIPFSRFVLVTNLPRAGLDAPLS